MPEISEINIDFSIYLPHLSTFKNYYDILRSHDYSSDLSMKTLQSLQTSENLQPNS